MTISYRWLMHYLPERLPLDELCDILTSIGLEVEGTDMVEAVKGSLEGLVIGKVLTCEQHPDADKLKLTTVDIGAEEPLSIVCGAPNVAQGQKVVVAPVGTTIYPTDGEPFKIKKAKIRGVASYGMLCAEDEIGVGASHDGIIVLSHSDHIGTPAKKHYNLPDPDHAIHIGLTPNRSDAMSHIGVARDVCAYLTHHRGEKYEVILPPTNMPDAEGDKVEVAVNIKASEACPRYMGVSVTDLKIGPSPDWLKKKLEVIGVRSINNVVDVTNYVLHEFGQPLHAFDIDKIKNNEINVQFLEQDTAFVTLDEEERKLNHNDLMICDSKGGMCIAGVFGGLGSGVTEATTSVFIESAYFHPTFVRRTSMHHDLRTDAATHFEKGVDINLLEPALKRAATLMVEVAGGRIASDILDEYEQEIVPAEVHVTYNYIKKLSGKEYSSESIKDILLALDFVIDDEDEEGLILKVPTNKPDVLQAADVVEEILRIDGLDNIEIPSRLNITLNRPMPNDRKAKNDMANMLSSVGFHEIVTNSIVNSAYYPDRTDIVKMLNSLSSELDVLRPSMLESGLEVIQYNCNRKSTDLALYEFGKIYTNPEGKYYEEEQLALYLTGNIASTTWNTKEQKTDIYYLKGLVQNMLSNFGINKVKVAYDEGAVKYSWKKQPLCTITEVDAKTLTRFDIKQPVYYVSIVWSNWLTAAESNNIKYQEVPKYPVVYRDLSLVLDKQVTYNEVERITNNLNISALQSYGLFDIFESEKLGKDKKSFALNYMFQLPDRTLTDKEIDKSMTKLIEAYTKQLQAQIRE